MSFLRMNQSSKEPLSVGEGRKSGLAAGGPNLHTRRPPVHSSAGLQAEKVDPKTLSPCHTCSSQCVSAFH